MKTRHRAILSNDQAEEKSRVKQACPQCNGAGAVRDPDPYADRRQLVGCPKCKGTGYLGALIALLLLLVCSANAATVNGTVRNRQGAPVSTNILFKAIQRPLFDFEPSVRPGWTVTTNSASDGTFSTELLAGNYQVTFGGELRDTFLIEVPTNSAAYDITTLTTNGISYRYNGTREFTNFVESVNGISNPTQLFATAESGTDFSISSAGVTHTFNLPTASASASGKLSSSDWTNFNARATQAQMTAASNALVSFAMTVSNVVYAAETTRNAAVSNAAVAFSMTASNTLYAFETTRQAAVSNAAIAFAMQASNDVYTVETTRNAAVSNAVAAFAMTVSNSVYAAETTRNAAVSNGAVALSIQASNDVYTAETTRNAAVSNAAVSFSMTMSNTLYGLETTRQAAVSNAAVAFTMTASNTLYRTGANLTTTGGNKFGLFSALSGGNLQFYGLEAGTNVNLYFNGSNIVINATGVAVAAATTFDSTSTTFDSTTVTFDAD